MSSNVEELNRLYPEWCARGLTWEAFGQCSEELFKGLMNKWLTDPEDKVILEYIWNRHPHRQQGLFHRSVSYIC